MSKKLKYFAANGDKFGAWVVIKEKQLGSRSLVRCTCGEERLVRTSDLVAGRSRSCGKRVCFSDYKNLIGQRFGFLSVIKISNDRYGNGSVIWECNCICGKICFVSSKHLLSGATKSCGCKKTQIKNLTTGLLSEEERAIKKVLSAYKNGAKTRKIDWNLSYDEVKQLISNNCHYCYSPPNKALVIKRTDNTIIFHFNGIDRINSDKDYTLNNCVSCCWICNRAKLDMPFEDFIKYIDNLVKLRSIGDLSYE